MAAAAHLHHGLTKLHGVGISQEEAHEFEKGDSDLFYAVAKRIYAMVKESKKKKAARESNEPSDPANSTVVKLVLLIKKIDNLICWKEKGESCRCMLLICIACVYICIFDFRWPLLAAVLYICTRKAPPISFLSGVFFGTTRYLCAIYQRRAIIHAQKQE